jgi:hypothetical protein
MVGGRWWRQPLGGLPAPAACRAARGSGCKGNLDLADEERSERSERRRPAGENPLQLEEAVWHPGHQPQNRRSPRVGPPASPCVRRVGSDPGRAGAASRVTQAKGTPTRFGPSGGPDQDQRPRRAGSELDNIRSMPDATRYATSQLWSVVGSQASEVIR